VELTRKELDGLGLQNIDYEYISSMDSVEFIKQPELACQAASRQVSLEHFGAIV